VEESISLSSFSPRIAISIATRLTTVAIVNTSRTPDGITAMHRQHVPQAGRAQIADVPQNKRCEQAAPRMVMVYHLDGQKTQGSASRQSGQRTVLASPNRRKNISDTGI